MDREQLKSLIRHKIFELFGEGGLPQAFHKAYKWDRLAKELIEETEWNAKVSAEFDPQRRCDRCHGPIEAERSEMCKKCDNECELNDYRIILDNLRVSIQAGDPIVTEVQERGPRGELRFQNLNEWWTELFGIVRRLNRSELEPTFPPTQEEPEERHITLGPDEALGHPLPGRSQGETISMVPATGPDIINHPMLQEWARSFAVDYDGPQANREVCADEDGETNNEEEITDTDNDIIEEVAGDYVSPGVYVEEMDLGTYRPRENRLENLIVNSATNGFKFMPTDITVEERGELTPSAYLNGPIPVSSRIRMSYSLRGLLLWHGLANAINVTMQIECIHNEIHIRGTYQFEDNGCGIESDFNSFTTRDREASEINTVKKAIWIGMKDIIELLGGNRENDNTSERQDQGDYTHPLDR